MSEELKNEELEQVSGGALGLHRSGPYKCPFCGGEYYVGDEEIHMGMCQKCWHDPDRLSKNNKVPEKI